MAVPSGFYAGSGTSADPYYGYYKGNNFTDGLLELDRADAIRYMSGEIDQYGNPIDERPIVFDDYLDTGVDPNNPNPPPPGTAPPPGQGAPPPGTGSGAGAADDAAYAQGDFWQNVYPTDTVYQWLEDRGGMSPDNPYYGMITGTAGGLQTLFDLLYNPSSMGDETNALFGNFVQDLFSTGGDYTWNLGMFRDIIGDIMSGNVASTLSSLLETTENPSGAMEVLRNLFEVFSPLMTPGARRAFEVQLAKVWQDMSSAYRNGIPVHQAFTEAVANLGRNWFGL